MSVFGDAPGMTPFKSRKVIQTSPRQASAAARASYGNSPRKAKPASTGSSKASAKVSPQKAISKISPKPSSISPALSLGMEVGRRAVKEAGVARQERLGRVFVCMNFGHFCLLSASTLFADAVPDWRLVTAGAKFSDERLRFAAYVGPMLPLIATGMTCAKRSQKMAHLLAFYAWFVAIFPPRAYVWAMSYFGALSGAALSGKIIFTVELFLPVLVHGIFAAMCLGGKSSKTKKKKEKTGNKVASDDFA